MQVIETKVYKFDELSDEAKEKAREWYRETMYDDHQFAAEGVTEDAANIGLKILAWDTDSCGNVVDMTGEFINGSTECMEAIFKEHGKDCETYKTAEKFDAEIDKLPDGDAPESRLDDYDAAESEFLHALLEDYRIMLQKEFEYRASDEAIDDNITANEYTFTEDGKRFG